MGRKGGDCQISWVCYIIESHLCSKFKGGQQCMCREVELCILNTSANLEVICCSTIPADHEKGEVGGSEGGGTRKKVEAVGEQHRGFSPKTESRVKSRKC